MTLLSVWWLKAVPMHPDQAKPWGALPERDPRARPPSVRTLHPKLGYLPNPPPAPWVPNPSLGNKKLQLHPVVTQHFFHCTGHAEQLLSYSYSTTCPTNFSVIFFFSIPHIYKQKNSSCLWNSAQSCLLPVVSCIAQRWELWPAGKVFAFKRGYSKLQRKPILYCCLPLCFDWEGSLNNFSHKWLTVILQLNKHL